MEIHMKVAASGTVERDDKRATCGKPMLYRCPAGGKVQASFCGSAACAAFLIEIPA